MWTATVDPPQSMVPPRARGAARPAMWDAMAVQPDEDRKEWTVASRKAKGSSGAKPGVGEDGDPGSPTAVSPDTASSAISTPPDIGTSTGEEVIGGDGEVVPPATSKPATSAKSAQAAA